MKKLSLLFCMTLMAWAGNSSIQSTADSILGRWQTGSGKAQVEIKKAGTMYYGQIVWLKNPLNEQGKAKTDVNNPDPSKRGAPLIGLRMLLGFEYAGGNLWKNGTIYDPENGKTYSCKAELVDQNTLNIRGYIGVSLLGRTDAWSRVNH